MKVEEKPFLDKVHLAAQWHAGFLFTHFRFHLGETADGSFVIDGCCLQDEKVCKEAEN